jgi:phosphatidylserine/phosphatidylglycerophosphate/cardiolipin synthase-like enzyme
LCAQSNNTIVARSPLMAAAYKTYWENLKADTVGDVGKQSPSLRKADAAGPIPVTLEDGSGDVDVWFSPNTAHLHRSNDPNEATPPDMQEISKCIAAAKQAVLFVAFEPGSPSIIDYVADALKANPALFVRGTVTVASAAEQFSVAIKSDAKGSGKKTTSPEGTTVPADYRVIPATGITDPVSVWERELNNAGFAVTHSKYVVIDPFSDGCVVITGSHNLGFRASSNNDENLAIVKGHRPLAEAYAANALDIYDHYAWRWWLSTSPKTAWTSLHTDDTWQNSYFDADSRPISPELTFWLAATPSSDALPAPSNVPSDRPMPQVREITSRGKHPGRT